MLFSLAHVNLAVNLLKRNKEVNVNDRIQYLFVENENKDAKKGELAEDPKCAKDNGLKFNRVCHTEQLAKPLCSFFKIVLKEESYNICE